jgi:hypothetical protein
MLDDADDDASVPCVPLATVRRAPARVRVVPCRAAKMMRLRLLTPRILAAYRRGTTLARIREDNGITDGSIYTILHNNRVPQRARSKGAK